MVWFVSNGLFARCPFVLPFPLPPMAEDALWWWRPLKKVSQSCRPSVPSLQQRSPLTKCKKNTLCTLLQPTKPHLLRHRDSLLDFVPGHHGSLIRRQTAGLQNYFPFLFVDVALYLLLEKNYFNSRLPLTHYWCHKTLYFSTDFLLMIYNLPTNNYIDFAWYLHQQ